MTARMTKAQAVAALNDVPTGDFEIAHGMADTILLAAVAPEVREAYEALVARTGYWVTA